MTSTQVRITEPAESNDESVVRIEGEYRGGWWYQLDWHTTDNRIEILVATTDSQHRIEETLLHLDVPGEDAAAAWKTPFGFLKYEKK